MSDVPFDGWWRASNGRWYPPEMRPGTAEGGPQVPPAGWFRDEQGEWRPPQARPAATAVDEAPATSSAAGEPAADPGTEPEVESAGRRSRPRRWWAWVLAVLCFVAGGLIGFALFDRSDDRPAPADPTTDVGSALPPVTLDATTSTAP